MKLVLVVLFALAVASPAAAIPVQILWSDFRIGQFRLKSEPLGTVVEVFGPPDTRTLESGACNVRWRIYGTQMTFVGSEPVRREGPLRTRGVRPARVVDGVSAWNRRARRGEC